MILNIAQLMFVRIVVLKKNTVKLILYKHEYSNFLDIMEFCGVSGKIPNKSLQTYGILL